MMFLPIYAQETPSEESELVPSPSPPTIPYPTPPTIPTPGDSTSPFPIPIPSPAPTPVPTPTPVPNPPPTPSIDWVWVGIGVAVAIGIAIGVEWVSRQNGIDLTKCPTTWLPEGTNTVTFTARTYKCVKGMGWVYPGKPKKITFYLETSSEKGICLNKGKSLNPDLWFVESADFKFSKDKTKDNACEKTILGVNNPPHKHYLKATTTKKVTEAKITVRCEDFGAFGSLEAKAWFTKQIPPRQPNQPVSCGGRSCCRGSNKVTIPLDENKNKIADSAPQDAGGASGKKDNDNTPAGNGTNGDGLSNYEEYRGFFIEGGTVPEQHIRTDITTKDIFIYDQHNLGIGYYAQTNLNVHILRDPALFNGTGSRIINFNRGFASGGIQHGLWLKRGTLNGPRGRAIGGPGLPGCIQSVVIDTRAIALEGIANMQNRVIAHELGHAINIRHHGQGGTHNSCGPNTERNGLQTSGDVTCVLRYTSYARGWCHALPHHRHNTENPALVGTTFCSSSNATGANNSGAGHQNNAGRGNCRGQIRVKDW